MQHFLGKLLLCFSVFSIYYSGAQTIGPNNPTLGSNNTAVGANAWTSPLNVVSSNSLYASVSTKGVTNYLSASLFGFGIAPANAINGIQLDVKKSTNSPTVVTVLDNWTTGEGKVISAGTSRCLLVVVSMENGTGARNITAMTYGGQSMTQVTEVGSGTAGGFMGKIEVWRLLNAGIAAATNSNIVATYDATALDRNSELFSSAAFTGVDQTLPVSSSATMAGTTAVPITLSPTIATTEGGMCIAAIHCGNNKTPAAAANGTTTSYSINSGFTEVIDTYSSNPADAAAGYCTEVSHKTIVTGGTEAPAFTFVGTANRQPIVCLNLQCLREIDNSVRLVKNGTITGNNNGFTTTPWPVTDTYISYGNATDLWGASWLVADINATNFGAVISASVNNGTARVDHMRIIVYISSALPIELVDFYGSNKDGKNELLWQTASEHNNKQFEIERSNSMGNFVKIATVAGQGNSRVFKSYDFTDEEPLDGLNYYRLKQVDYDGTFKYSKNIVINNGQNSENAVLVYPNPSSDGRFTIAAKQLSGYGIYIYSSDLKFIKQIPADTDSYNFSLQELTDGVYYLIYNLGTEQKIKKIEKVCRSN